MIAAVGVIGALASQELRDPIRRRGALPIASVRGDLN